MSRDAGGRVVKAPKSSAGRRSVVMPAPVAEAMVQHLARFTAAAPDVPVFAGPRGGRLAQPNFTARTWHPVLEVCGLVGTHFHDLRHCAGTWAAQSGATVAELQARLGHASPDAAHRYQQVGQDRDRALADRLGAMMVPPLDLADAVPIEAVNAQTTRKRPKVGP